MIKTIEDRIIEHLPGRYHDTLKCYEVFEHEDWEDRDPNTGELIGFVSYFFLDFSYDMIITAAKNNKFSREQWRVIRRAVKKRAKTLRICSDPNNPTLVSVVKRMGGYWIEDEIIFPGAYNEPTN